METKYCERLKANEKKGTTLRRQFKNSYDNKISNYDKESAKKSQAKN